MMTRLTRRDLRFSVVTGLTAGFIGWQVLTWLRVPSPFGIPLISLLLLMPCVWLAAVSFGYFVGRWLPFLDRLGKFSVVGFTNFAVDAGTMNLLIALSGVTRGVQFAAFKAGAFGVAVVHSYVWNRLWVFESRRGMSASELIKFAGIALSTLFVNVIVATSIAGLNPAFGLSDAAWVNVAVAAGAAGGMASSFVGFHVFVFGE
jgi:putative flippase GtrA